MKLWFLAGAISLLAACSGQTSERNWTQVGQEGDITYYADISAIHQADNKATMWMLSDFAGAHEDSKSEQLYYSQVGFFEFDCENKQGRILHYARHSENLGQGEAVFTRDIPDNVWREIIEETQREAEWALACRVPL